MKVTNLDKFKLSQKVILDGTEYTVKGITVKQFINDASESVEDMNEAERFEHYVKRLASMTDIPVEVLKEQELGVVVALFQISQGIDPEDESEADGGEGNPQ